jgi:hypothetical protein
MNNNFHQNQKPMNIEEYEEFAKFFQFYKQSKMETKEPPFAREPGREIFLRSENNVISPINPRTSIQYTPVKNHNHFLVQNDNNGMAHNSPTSFHQNQQTRLNNYNFTRDEKYQEYNKQKQEIVDLLTSLNRLDVIDIIYFNPSIATMGKPNVAKFYQLRNSLFSVIKQQREENLKLKEEINSLKNKSQRNEKDKPLQPNNSYNSILNNNLNVNSNNNNTCRNSNNNNPAEVVNKIMNLEKEMNLLKKTYEDSTGNNFSVIPGVFETNQKNEKNNNNNKPNKQKKTYVPKSKSSIKNENKKTDNNKNVDQNSNQSSALSSNSNSNSNREEKNSISINQNDNNSDNNKRKDKNSKEKPIMVNESSEDSTQEIFSGDMNDKRKDEKMENHDFSEISDFEIQDLNKSMESQRISRNELMEGLYINYAIEKGLSQIKLNTETILINRDTKNLRSTQIYYAKQYLRRKGAYVRILDGKLQVVKNNSLFNKNNNNNNKNKNNNTNNIKNDKNQSQNNNDELNEIQKYNLSQLSNNNSDENANNIISQNSNKVLTQNQFQRNNQEVNKNNLSDESWTIGSPEKNEDV